MTDLNREGLARCPFCGIDHTRTSNRYTDHYQVHCMACGADGPSGQRMEIAIAAWNRRAHTPATDTTALVEARVKVKPLVWERYENGGYVCREWDFRLSEENGKWGLSPIDWPAFDHPYSTLEAAKAAADADHARRVLSCVVSAPAAVGEGDTPLWWFLHILNSMGGKSSSGDDEWVGAFCEEGRDPDTFNRAEQLGLTRTSHDTSFDLSTVYLTDAGRAWLAASRPTSEGGNQ